MSSLTELERDLLEALNAMLQVFGGSPNATLWEVVDAREVAARAEAKAKEPQCKPVNDLDPRHHGFQEFHPNAWGCAICGHDRACHLGAKG